MQSKLFLTISVLVLVLGLSFAALADTIRLKDGTTVKGKVIGFRGQQFIILLEENSKGRRSEMKLYPEDIESIEFDGDVVPTAPKSPTSTSGNSGNSSNSNNSTGTASTSSNSTRPTTDDDDRSPIVVGKSSGSTNSSTRPNANSGNSNSSTRPNSNGSVVQVINSQPPTASTNANTNSNSGNSTVVGNTPNTSTGSSNTTVSNTPNTSTGTTSTNSNGNKVTMNIKVLADNTANGWTNAGIVLKKGQRLRISSTGRVSLGNGRFSTPAGVSSLPDKDKLMQAEPTGALIAVLGLDNNDFVFIGSTREFIAQRDGILFLGVNDGFLDDNSGAFDVTVEVENK